MQRYVNIKEGKSLSKTIFGQLAKFHPGKHKAEVTVIVKLPDYVRVMFSLPDGSFHVEDFEDNPGLSALQTVWLTIGHGPGYLVFRLPDGNLQARDAITGDNLTPPMATAEELVPRLSCPQSQPQIKEITVGNSKQLQFKLRSAKAAGDVPKRT
jgi:hypothetical protein